MEKQATLKEKVSTSGARAAGRPARRASGDAGRGPGKGEFAEKVQRSNELCQRGDFQAAVDLYGEALRADAQNCILYGNRSAALLKLGRHQAALDDAEKARVLNPKWPKAYFRQGVALQYLGRHADALAAFASGLAQDPKSLQLLVGMVEAAMKSPMRESLEPTYQQLQKMKLDKSPFVVVSVIGQELLTAGHHTASVVVLEAALKIGTCSLKLRGSVFSALSSAHWSLGNTEKSTGYMQQDLEVAKTLGDQTGECRAHGNLGSAFFSKGNYREALTNHRNQLVLAMKLKDREAASMALSSLGHVYTAIGDYPNALASHKQCVLLAKQSKDQLSEARELGNMGAVYIAMGDFDNAVQCHEQHLGIAKALENKREEARAYSNLGSAYHYHRNFDKAMSYHTHVLELAQELEEKSIEMRAYAGLGHAARCMQDLERAKQYHEQQLSIAEGLKDRAAEGRASSNLGIIHQMKGDYETALKLHKTHLAIAQELNDYAAQGRAYGNMGNAYNALGAFDQAVRYHRQELQISMEVNDRASQASTHGNLAVAYQSLGAHDRALQHYQNHLNIARELRDVQSEARALGNLGNFHCSRGEFPQAVPYYEQYLRLSPDLQDMESEGKVCHNLGYAHYCLGNYQDAVKYYEQDLALAKDLHDKLSQAKAYCNLGLAFKALGDFAKAEECQKYLLSLAQSLNNSQARFRALGNLGDIFVCKKDVAGAIQFYEQQLALAHQVKERRMEACAYAALGATYRLVHKYDKALGYHTQELEVYQELGDMSGECKAHGHLAAVYMALGKYAMAFKSYEEQLELGQRLKDPVVEAQVYGNMGITKMNVGVMEEAIGYLEQQLATLQQLSGNEAVMDRGRAYGNLGDCYEALGDFEEAIKYYDQYLSVAQSLNRMQDQEKAYRGLGNGHRATGNLQQSLVCFEKRLVVAHELGECGVKAQAYGELGALHSQLGNYEQAISCLERQLVIARDTQDRLLEGDASCGLGAVYQTMGEYETALRCHQSDLEIAEEAGSPARQARAYGNLGLTYESLGNYERAVVFQEQHLSVAAQTNDLAAKTLAYGSLGRTHHALQNYSQAVMYLQEGLRLAEQLARREEEAKIRHRLGLSLWASGNLEEAQHQLYRASALFETIRHEAQHSTDYKLSLFDLQTSCYQALQRVLVSLGHHDEALAVAERGRTRAFADLLVERQTGQQDSDPYTPVTVEHILDTVNSQRALVLYFSMAAGYLYSWLLAPGAGILKFHEVYLGEGISEVGSDFQEGGGGLVGALSLEQHIASAREALGVESYYSRGCSSSETESEAGDLLDQQFEELNNKLNSVTDPTGFLRMVSRNNLFNRSCQSMTSLFSNTMSPAKDGCSSLPHRSGNLGKPPLRALYDLLIAPMEGGLMHSSGPVGRHRQLVMVLEGELYLIPFALLKGSSSNEYLYERFSLIAVPSIQGLGSGAKVHSRRPGPAPCGGVSMAAVVGNPRLPSPVMDRWLWGPMPSAEEEALMVAELLGCQPLSGTAATKERVMSALTQAECAHFATHISWKLAALVLTPNPESLPGAASANVGGGTIGRGTGIRRGSSGRGRKGSVGSGYTNPESHLLQDDSSDVDSICDSPPLQEFLLTAADILDLRLPVKLVVLGSYLESSSKVTADGVVGLTRSFLAAGAQCVLVSLWPVPVAASKVFIHAFYTALLNGTKASAALADAMKTVQSSKQYSHPSNWAGYMLIGTDVKLNSPSSLIGQALAEILQYPDRARDALRVLLHLVEKSLQRIQNGQRNSMYTSQQSVENKVGGVPGWQALLTAVGFRLDSAGTGIPAAVFFPTADPGDRLQQCSTTLQSLLGLPPQALQALCKLITASEAGEQLINRLHQVLVQLQTGEKEQDFSLLPIQVSISVQLWRLPGCHEFLAALGFDLCEVGQEEVVLKTGKLANRRTLHFALQSLLALFDSTELPKRLSLDSSSSLESLASAQSVSNPLPMGYSSLPFSPHCLDNQASDAISVYSLSSVASSMSFASKSDCDFLSHRHRSGAAAHYAAHKHPHVPRSRSSPHGAATATSGARGEEEEYEGFSIISSEPLGSHCDSLPLPPGHSQRHHRGGRGVAARSASGAGRGYSVSVSSRGSVSTPTSPVKTCLVPSPNSPFQKVAKVTSSDTGESDQSSTETDSTVKSQEEKSPPLDPQELAQKILEETHSHLRAVGSLQRARAEGGTSRGNSPGSSAFRSSETSAFSRPNSSASGRAQSSPKPKPPSRSSSLQKISSGYNSPAVSESSQKDGSHPSPISDSHAQFKLKYPSSPYSGHISRSPSNVSPSSGHQSPVGSSAPSPALSYSSTGSATSADVPDLDRLRRGVIDEKVQAIHNLKTFWANAAAQQHLGPIKAVHSSPSPLASASRDVLSLLNLSPRHCSPNDTQDSLELRDLGLQSVERGGKNSNGHHCSSPKKGAPSPTISTSSSPGARSIRLPAGNGYKFLSPGRFFPSSKC
ncbi:tetratricopeptide repeat protein 28-like isoform X1 [Syngnathoides biaculeatus]|uniref:tetratricopeptide repeat protein 28-like isoform X1 n=2 Tax=Syngnathoides biaculeatus TaxID=300417 RepID=UPI002ADD97A3|nr:tetratricopeptide repeat protein 28-like isoform X1 [Syngnathoides biaculeatus]XP_061672970.1 tetratricopeptide repeat protein 28-like isoform X1 [Syngnathoides biaculeatus]XP_061672971.1 tetratricopeptide repeat protein 28-like isoform X1 [Syngnathoides biaculeatus]